MLPCSSFFYQIGGKSLNRFYRRICDIEVLLAMILLGTSVSIIFIAAILRTAGHPIRWGNDIALMLFAWSTFTSADIVFRIKRHVVVDILTARLPKFLQFSCELLVHAIILFLLSFISLWHEICNCFSCPCISGNSMVELQFCICQPSM